MHGMDSHLLTYTHNNPPGSTDPLANANVSELCGLRRHRHRCCRGRCHSCPAAPAAPAGAAAEAAAAEAAAAAAMHAGNKQAATRQQSGSNQAGNQQASSKQAAIVDVYLHVHTCTV